MVKFSLLHFSTEEFIVGLFIGNFAKMDTNFKKVETNIWKDPNNLEFSHDVFNTVLWQNMKWHVTIILIYWLDIKIPCDESSLNLIFLIWKMKWAHMNSKYSLNSYFHDGHSPYNIQYSLESKWYYHLNMWLRSHNIWWRIIN